MAIDDLVFGDQSPITAPIGSFPTHGSEKLMVVIFIVDCSKTMEINGRIQAVNAALNELRYRLSEIKSNNNLDLKMAIMGFTSSAKWELGLTPIDEVVLNSISVRAGLTEYGVVFRELNRVLSKDEFMNHVGKKAAPVIIFLTDGEPTDDYSSDLETLMKNGWFSCANRSAILMGDSFNNDLAKTAVEKFVSNPHTDVVSADDTTVVTEKITAATIHTIAGDPDKDISMNDSTFPSDPATPDDLFDPNTSFDPHIMPFLGDANISDNDTDTDASTVGNSNNSSSSNDASYDGDQDFSNFPFADDLFDPIFPDDPSIASNLSDDPFSDDVIGSDDFS